MVDWKFYIDEFLGSTERNGLSCRDVTSIIVFQTTLKYYFIAFFKKKNKMTFTNECSYVQKDLPTMALLESTTSKGGINISSE